jgi:hypothetical protein
MPYPHGFEESLNNQEAIRKQNVKIHIMVVLIIFKMKKIINYMLKGRIETNQNRRRAGELVTLIDEPYLAFLFNYLPSPPSAPAVGAISVVVTVAYIAAVVELSLAFLCSRLCYIVKSQYQDVYTLNQ